MVLLRYLCGFWTEARGTAGAGRHRAVLARGGRGRSLASAAHGGGRRPLRGRGAGVVGAGRTVARARRLVLIVLRPRHLHTKVLDQCQGLSSFVAHQAHCAFVHNLVKDHQIVVLQLNVGPCNKKKHVILFLSVYRPVAIFRKYLLKRASLIHLTLMHS